MTLAELNALGENEATKTLARCCGSARWTKAMVARRPFRDRDQLLAAADDIWWSLEGADWLEAFSHHPRIGERAEGWPRGEQSGMERATTETARALAEGNRMYERRFGHVFLICATGKSGDEMLASLRQRLTNDPATELRVAAAEQAKITRLRLAKLVSDEPRTGAVP